MARKYYSLIAKYPGDEKWSIQFGDYDPLVVDKEMKDTKDSGSFKKGTKLKIMKSGSSQTSISIALAELNK